MSRHVEDLPPISSIEYAVLLAVAQQPKHGARVIQQVAHNSEGLMELGKGTVYPALRKLERYQLIHCREELRGPSAHPTRVFEIAPAGWVVLAAETSKWRPGLIR